MRLTRQHSRPGSVELNMTPMIDVIFQLLIFFMCASSMAVAENLLQSQVSGPGKGPAVTYPPVTIRLIGDAKGVTIRCNDEVRGDFKALTADLKQRAALAPGKIDAIIEGDRGVPFGFMAAALDACHAAELKKVAFSTGRNAP